MLHDVPLGFDAIKVSHRFGGDCDGSHMNIGAKILACTTPDRGSTPQKKVRNISEVAHFGWNFFRQSRGV
jgi:hypothetical protein